MASRDKVDVDTFHKSIQYALEKLGKSKSGFERTVVSKFKRKRRVGSGNELVDYSRAPCLGADQKARGLWERDCISTVWPNLHACAQQRTRRVAAMDSWSVTLYETLTPGYAMLMSPKQDETAVHGCHSTGTLLCACVKVRPDRGDV